MEKYNSSIWIPIESHNSIAELLNELIAECKVQTDLAEADIANVQSEIDGYEHLSAEITNRYDKIMSW